MAHSESMKQVSAKLRDIGLEMYSDKFEEQGFDDLSMLEENTKEELEQIADSVNMKPGHKMKLLKLAKTDAIALGAAVQPAVQLVQPTVQPVQPAVQLAVASPAVVQPDVMTQNAPPQQMPNINIVNTNTNTNANTNKHGFNGLPCCPCGIGCQTCLFSCCLDSCCCGPCGCCGEPHGPTPPPLPPWVPLQVYNRELFSAHHDRGRRQALPPRMLRMPRSNRSGGSRHGQHLRRAGRRQHGALYELHVQDFSGLSIKLPQGPRDDSVVRVCADACDEWSCRFGGSSTPVILFGEGLGWGGGFHGVCFGGGVWGVLVAARGDANALSIRFDTQLRSDEYF